MSNPINLPDFAAAASQAPTITILEPARYTLEIREVRQQTIKNGEYAGSPVLNIAFVTQSGGEDGVSAQVVWIWKQLPMFSIPATDTKGTTWMRLSTMAFATALGLKGSIDPDALVGQIVECEVGVQARADRPEENQNFIKTFIATA